MLELLQRIALETLGAFLTAAPYILLGLVVAGFMHRLLPQRLIERWMGRRGLSGAALASAIGVPLPVCSCGVVPIAVELRNKGASRPSTLGFLITTPESSLDSIVLSWGLMGPIMAVARPVAAFLTAIWAGILSIAFDRDESRVCSTCGGQVASDAEHGTEQAGHEPHHDHEHLHRHGHDHEHDHRHALTGDAEQTYAALGAWWARLRGKEPPTDDEPRERVPGPWTTLIRPAFRYAFTDLLDNLVFWLMFGLGAAGVLGALLPADLAQRGLGSGLLPMLVMVVAGVPLYMCASASTPVAATLIAKGLSPGAGLVFLLTGPATNISTILVFRRVFGQRFVVIYLTAIASAAVACGLALDWLLLTMDWKIDVLATFSEVGTKSWIEWLSFAVLMTTSTWRLSGGAAVKGFRELKGDLASLGRLLFGAHPGRTMKRWLPRMAVAAAAGWLVVAGAVAVPLESRGYGFVFGRLVVDGAEPGLHWLPPIAGRWEVRAVELSRKADVGFQTETELLRRRRELTLLADPQGWHSPVAAMNPDPRVAGYLTGDENFVEMTFSVHYTLDDPTAFIYGLDAGHPLVRLYAEAVARELVGAQTIDELLTTERRPIEEAIAQGLQARLDDLEAGARISSVQVVDIHPPGSAVFAFRDVSSARENRETRIHEARRLAASAVPRARGNAARELAAAQASASARTIEATGRAEAFMATADAYRRAPTLLSHLLWLETTEEALHGVDKLIVPADENPRAITIWRREAAFGQ
jgi:HflK protein